MKLITMRRLGLVAIAGASLGLAACNQDSNAARSFRVGEDRLRFHLIRNPQAI